MAPVLDGDAKALAAHAQNGDESVSDEEVVIEVPADAKPGVTKLGVKVKDSGKTCQLVVTVPETSEAGDHLVIRRVDSEGWKCRAIRKKVAKEASVEETPTDFPVFVPAWAVPGTTQLKLQLPGNATLSLLVPSSAKPGDKLQMSRAPGSTCWKCVVVHEKINCVPKDDKRKLMDPLQARAQPPEPEVAFEKLTCALRAQGGFVSPKITRGRAPPLNIPGVIAQAPIEKGEELCKIPLRFFLSPSVSDKAMPGLDEVLTELLNTSSMTEDSRNVLKTAALVARLVSMAEGRAAAQQGLKPADTDGDEALRAAAADRGTWDVWERYADALLAVDLSAHPAFRAAADRHATHAEWGPSLQGLSALEVAAQLPAVASSLLQAPSSPLGPHPPSEGMLCRGQLLVRTRSFLSSMDCTLVPIAEDFNHSATPGAAWSWREAEGVMVVVATRDHAAGEEIFHSYGHTANGMLYNGYGFTVPPQSEETWHFMPSSDISKTIYDVYLPPELNDPALIFDSRLMDDSLVTAMNAAAKNGCDAGELISLICARWKTMFEADESLRPALDALQRARAKRRASHKWWEELPGEETNCLDSDVFRVKMSEYLCIEAHIEAILFAKGMLEEEDCLEGGGAKNLRKTMASSLRQLRENGHFMLRTQPVGPPAHQGISGR